MREESEARRAASGQSEQLCREEARWGSDMAGRPREARWGGGREAGSSLAGGRQVQSSLVGGREEQSSLAAGREGGWAGCKLDRTGCLSLQQILASFTAPISEEHAWAVIHQVMDQSSQSTVSSRQSAVDSLQPILLLTATLLLLSTSVHH